MTHIPAALRQVVRERGKQRCEYCLLHEDNAYFSHEIDHIYAEKHGGETTQINLCLACADCNRYEDSDLCSIDPQSGEVVSLFHPRKEQWQQHFRLIDTGIIASLTATGRVTERILRFNRLDLVDDRQRLIKIGRYKEYL